MDKKGMMKSASVLQVLILIFGVIAIGYAFGSSLEGVDGQEDITYEKAMTRGFEGDAPLPTDGNDRNNGNDQDTGDEQDPEDGNGNGEEGPTGGSSALASFLGGDEIATGGAADSILTGLQWGGIVYGVVSLIGMFVPEEYSAYADAAAPALAAGTFVGKGIHTGLQGEGVFTGDGLLNDVVTLDGNLGSTQAGLFWGGVVSLAVFYFMYQDEAEELVTFTCDPWEAPTGGENCELCNEQPGDLPCSEYQCRSLGQACELLNKGTSEERCEWVNRNDVEHPTIQPWEAVLTEDHDYNPDETISPPDRGVKIERRDSTSGCIKAFTPLSFGIETNEPAKCKLDYTRKENFKDMRFNFGGNSLFRYNHTQVMNLPGPQQARSENLTIQNDGDFELYVRCQDANGNHNTGNFVFKYCVEDGPDTTPPQIVSTNLFDGMPVAYNQSRVDIELYTNEPANCKWSKRDQNYENMENGLECSSSIREINTQMLYTCSGELDGIRNRQSNDFYFRCNDNEGNENRESFEFSLEGTRPLVIEELGPTETIRDHTDIVTVELSAETRAGHNEGQSTCYYSPTGEEGDEIKFFDTNNENGESTQELQLPEGSYNYTISCIDLGGNEDQGTVEFDVEVDNEPPEVLRAYHENTYLKIVTDESANCVYDTQGCNYNFEDGNEITAQGENAHFIDWSTENSFYVKCQDQYENRPSPDQCSITARPFETFQSEE